MIRYDWWGQVVFPQWVSMIIPQSSRSKMVQAFKPLPSLGSFGGFDASGCSGSCHWRQKRIDMWLDHGHTRQQIVIKQHQSTQNYHMNHHMNYHELSTPLDDLRILLWWHFHDNAQRENILRGWVHAFPASLGCHSQGPPPPSVLSTCHRFYPAKRLERARQGDSKDLYCRCRLALREAQGASTPEAVSVASWKHQTLDQAGKLSL